MKHAREVPIDVQMACQASLMGCYTDDLVRNEGLWKIQHKSVRVGFRAA